MANEQYAGRARQAAEAAIQQMSTEQPAITDLTYRDNFVEKFKALWSQLAVSDAGSVSESASVTVNVQASDSAAFKEQP